MIGWTQGKRGGTGKSHTQIEGTGRHPSWRLQVLRRSFWVNSKTVGLGGQPWHRILCRQRQLTPPVPCSAPKCPREPPTGLSQTHAAALRLSGLSESAFQLLGKLQKTWRFWGLEAQFLSIQCQEVGRTKCKEGERQGSGIQLFRA